MTLRVTAAARVQVPGLRHGFEDAAFVSLDSGILAVADGVTRLSYSDAGHEQSRRVRLIANAICRSSCAMPVRHSAQDWTEDVARRANEIVRRLNQIWYGPSWTQSDIQLELYGAVGAFVALKGEQLWVGSLGDCFAGLWTPGCGLVRINTDQVRGCSALLDSMQFASRTARARWAQTHLRNQIAGVVVDRERFHYGVLDGSSKALEFLEHRTVPVHNGCHIVLCSDGAEPILSDPSFESAMARIEFDSDLTTVASHCRQWLEGAPDRNDDATIVVGAIGEAL